MIIGVGGSGKSVLARHLGEILGIEVFHLDAYHWRPGWETTPRSERIRIQTELIGRQAWIIDGNYSGTLDIRLAVADTVIFLDFARYVCLWRVLKRALLRRPRPDMAPGCPERLLSWSFLRFLGWIWGYPATRRPRILEKLGEYSNGRRIVTLHNAGEADRFLDRVRADRTLDTSANAPL